MLIVATVLMLNRRRQHGDAVVFWRILIGLYTSIGGPCRWCVEVEMPVSQLRATSSNLGVF